MHLLATSLTTPHFMGDTADYVASIVRGIEFWEFGHLFWRPLGWLCYQAFLPVTSLVVGADAYLNATLTLIWLNWLAGLCCVLLLYHLIYNLLQRRAIACGIAIAFLFSHAFLNFAQTGSSYIPGLAFLLLGLHLSTRQPDAGSNLTYYLAGAAFAAAVGFWFLFILVIPAALLCPLILFGKEKRPLPSLVKTTLVFLLLVGLCYAIVMIHLQIYTLAAFKAWVVAASHGMKTSGISRVIFGIPRSFIAMENYGLLFKRFLLQDPYNPVSPLQLLVAHFWKLLLFGLMFAALAITIWRSPQRKQIFALVVLAAAPLLAFATRFSGSDIERYLPLYPLLFVTAAYTVANPPSRQWLKAIVVAFFIIAGVVNFTATANWRLHREQGKVAQRVSPLLPALNPQSWIFTLNEQDELINFKRSFPFNEISQRANLNVAPVLRLNTTELDSWRNGFAESAKAIWAEGGSIWLSNRLFRAASLPEWYWAEGDDKRIAWAEVVEFFSRMQTESISEMEDGFRLLSPSEQNRLLLSRQETLQPVAQSSQTERP